MTVDSLTLERISKGVMETLRNLESGTLKSHLSMLNYHGFGKSILPLQFVENALKPFDISRDDLQLEIGHVRKDLSGQIHYHKEAFAYITCLGHEVGLDPPDRAYAFLSDRWNLVSANEIIKIPPGTPHGFSVRPGGNLYFLTVQAPPIVRQSGSDDYVLCPPRPLPD